MNWYGVLIVSTLLLKFTLDSIARWLNLKSLNPALPLEYADLYDSEKYRKSQQYTIATTRFGFLESAVDLTILLAFWYGGGFPWLDQIVRARELGPVPSGILYIGMISVASGILGIPFDLYSTFVIEERFGFNRTSLSTFILDRLKGLVLGALLGIPLLSAVLWFFEAAGSLAWVYCWIIVTVLGFIIQFAAPVWILPLFNKFTPLQDGDLKEAISRYAGEVKFSFSDVFVMDGSRRSSKANAFFTGFGKNKRIGLFDTLVSQHTGPEVLAVLAHEIGHYKKRHIQFSMMTGFAHTGLLFFLLSIFVRDPYLLAAFGMEHVSVYAGMIFFGMLYEPLSFLLGIVMNVISRRHELEADRYAVETTSDRDHLISSLKRLHVQNLSNLTPHPFYVFLNYSHPPLLQRVEAIQAISPLSPVS